MEHKKIPKLVVVVLAIIFLFSLIFVLNNITSLTIFDLNKENINLERQNSVIELTNAQHLDSNLNFISDIYEEVKELDDIWSEFISSGEYIRITFEKNLTSENYIKIFSKRSSGEPRIEIYESGGTELISEFTNLISGQYNKIPLTNLQRSQNSFDLRVLEGSVEIDHIIDPPGSISDGGSFPIIDDSIQIGENTSVYVTLTHDGDDPEQYHIFIEDTSDNRIYDVCESNQIRIIGVTEDHADCSPASSNSMYNDYVDCTTNFPQGGTLILHVNYTIQGCSGGSQLTYRLDATTTTRGGTDFTGSDILTVSAPDNPPNWYSPSVNDSTPNPLEAVRHNVNWTDDNTMRYATLEVNATGAGCNTWDNVTSATLSAGSEWANLTWQIPNACEGKTIGWRQYANDSNAQWNVTSTGIYNVQEVYPQFSNHQRNPATPNEDQDVQVNVTITEASLETVILEWEATTNYTITTNNSNEFYYTVLQGNYTPHDSVTYYWYANDTLGNLNKSAQQSFTVANQIPTVTQPAINDTNPYTNDLISCNGGTFSDNDTGDTESSREFKWYNNSVEVSGQTSQTLDLTVAGLDKGYVILCSIRVSDSYDWSSWQNSSNSATIQNSAPIISNPQTTVTWNANDSTYIYDYDATDLDSDSFTWYDNTSLFDIDSSTGEISDTPTEDQAGTYAIEINVSDGTVNTTDVFLYTINDVTQPNITVISPTNSSYNTQTIWFNATATEAITTWILNYNGTNITHTINTSLSVEDGNHHLFLYGNDSSGNLGLNDTIYFQVDATPPSISNESSNETNITLNDYFCVNITVTDSLNSVSVVYAEVWNTAIWVNYTMSDTGSTSCDGGNEDGVYGAKIQGNSVGLWNYSKVYANDTLDNWNSYDFSDLTINITGTPDNNYPLFSNFQEYLSNNSAYSNGQNYQFNSTITFTNSTAFLDFDGTNYSASNISNEFYVDFGSLAVGTYNYYWGAYGNGSQKHYNASNTRTYVITQKTSTCQVLFNETPLLEYGNSFTVFTDCDPTFTLYRNGTTISNNSIQSLGADAYNFTVMRTDTINYTNTYDEETFIINKITPIGSLTNSGSWTITYPTEVTIGYSQSNNGDNDLSYTVWRDNVNKSSGEIITLGYGTYDYKLNTSSGQNYTSNTSMDTQILTVNQNTSACNVYVNETSPINYSTSILITTDCTSSYKLYINGSEISNNSKQTLGADAYNFTVMRTDTVNYTNTYDEETFIINKNPDICGVYFNKSSPIDYPNLFEAYTNCSSAYTLYQNATSISNASIVNSGAGYFNFTVQRTDTINYSHVGMSQFFTVTKATPVMTYYLNGAQNNVSVDYPSTINASASTTVGTVNIYRDGTSVISENNLDINLTAGTYTYIFNVTGNANYSDVSSEYLYFELNQSTSNCQVLFNETSILDYGNSFRVYTDCDPTFTLYRNGTTISNNSIQSLGADAYNFTVQRTDTVNYTNIYDEETFIITKATGIVYAYIDGFRNNRTVGQYEEKYLNATLNTGTGNIKLYYNDSLINQGSSPLANLTNFTTVGVFNLTAFYEGNENYTSDFETWWVNVSEAPDYTNPEVSINTPINQTYPTNSILFNITATDNKVVTLCEYSLNNGITNYSMSNSGDFYTDTNYSMNQGLHTVIFYCKDGNNNLNNTEQVTFFIDSAFPSFSNYQRSPATPNEDQDVQVNATITEASLALVILEWDATTNYTITTNNGNEYYYTVLQANYTPHDSVTYYWYANDSSGNLNKSAQQSFTVANQIPTVSQPAINDTTPYTNELISCDSGTFSDDDTGDTESSREFKWYNNSVEVSGETSQTLDLTITGLDKGDEILCSVRVSDSYDWSSWQNSSNTATIQNSAPTIDNPQTTVTWNANGSTYTYDYDATDLDSDSFTWYDNTSLFDIDSSTGEISDTPTEDQVGTYAIEINVSDGTANTTDVFLYTINDPNAPIINLVDPTEDPGTTVFQDYIEINITASDSNLDTITIRLYDSNKNLINISYSNTSPFYLQYPSLSSGIYFYNATANDTETNSANTETRNITLNADPPTLTILSPENETYLSNESILLNYSVNGEDFIWYNIDLGDNTTISTPTYFNTTQGFHTLYLYANNSLGTTTNTISFTTNSTKFIIYYDEFKGANRGSSTRFNQKKYGEIQNLSNIILENTQFGKIEFNEIINLTDDEDPNDNMLDLDNYTNISNNRIELNSTALSNFNKSATLYLYGLTFSNPRILKDGYICPSAICVKNTYSGGVLSFNVTGFTVYSAEQTPGTPVTPPGGGGGGGAATPECSKNEDCIEDEVCLDNKCVNLFDIKIINFPLLTKAGEFFEFTYFMKGMQGVNGDVEVSFWIEKDNEKASPGTDVIYLSEFEEKTETTKILIPSTTEQGVYEFFVQVKYEDYIVHASRTIEIESKVKKSGTSSNKEFNFSNLYYFLGILLFLILMFFIMPKLKKIKQSSKEEKIRKRQIRKFLKQEKLRETKEERIRIRKIQKILKKEELRKLKEKKPIIIQSTKKITVSRPKLEIPGIKLKEKQEFDYKPKFTSKHKIKRIEKPIEIKDIIRDIAEKEKDHKLVEHNHMELEVPKPSYIHRSKQEILDALKKQFEKEEIIIPIKTQPKRIKKKSEVKPEKFDIIGDMVKKEQQARRKFIKDNFGSEDIIEDMAEKEEENGKFE